MNSSPKQLLILDTVPINKIPKRSSAFAYFHEFQETCRKIPFGQAVELDPMLIDEHRARKYLRMLNGEGEEFEGLKLETTAPKKPSSRRRVFIAKYAPVDLTLSPAD
jgi:hypothetical protein